MSAGVTGEILLVRNKQVLFPFDNLSSWSEYVAVLNGMLRTLALVCLSVSAPVIVKSTDFLALIGQIVRVNIETFVNVIDCLVMK